MRVKLSTVLTPDYLPGDYFRILWDAGTGGELVTLADKVPAFAGQELGPIFGQRVWGAGTFSGRAAIANTFANRLWGAGSFAIPMGRAELMNKVIEKAGLYRFAIQSYDFLGNAAAADQWKTFDVWICEAPQAPRELKATNFDIETNRLTFGFVPSRSLRS